ncbi:MAG: DUF2306 domain-containing protein, partial [Vitreimonas sp.]
MSETVAPRAWETNAAAHSALLMSAIVWFIPALIGQWFLAYHVAETYLTAALAGDYAAWNNRLFVGLVDGDGVGNIALVVHLVIAFIVSIGGPLQLIPQIRTQAPAFHRWNGRLFIFTGVLTSLAALYMTWTRDTFGPDILEIPVSINGVLILLFAVVAMRYAVARNIEAHQRWALRTFMVMSGVWFVRVIYGFLGAFPGDIPGSTEDMAGPTNLAVGYASFLLPLAMLELYFLAKRSPGASLKTATAALVFAAAAATGIGVYRTAVNWLS